MKILRTIIMAVLLVAMLGTTTVTATATATGTSGIPAVPAGTGEKVTCVYESGTLEIKVAKFPADGKYFSQGFGMPLSGKSDSKTLHDAVVDLQKKGSTIVLEIPLESWIADNVKVETYTVNTYTFTFSEPGTLYQVVPGEMVQYYSGPSLKEFRAADGKVYKAFPMGWTDRAGFLVLQGEPLAQYFFVNGTGEFAFFDVAVAGSYTSYFATP